MKTECIMAFTFLYSLRMNNDWNATRHCMAPSRRETGRTCVSKRTAGAALGFLFDRSNNAGIETVMRTCHTAERRGATAVFRKGYPEIAQLSTQITFTLPIYRSVNRKTLLFHSAVKRQTADIWLLPIEWYCYNPLYLTYFRSFLLLPVWITAHLQGSSLQI